MDKKIASYANGFNVSVYKNTGETLITFVQHQPGFNPESGKQDLDGSAEVIGMILPTELSEELAHAILECIKSEETADNIGE